MLGCYRPRQQQKYAELTRDSTDSGPDFGGATATRALAGDQDDVTLAYSLEGADAASFAIDTATGQLATVEGVVYDFETRASYAVTVRAGSSAGARATIAVTVNLTDEQEPPLFDGTGTTRTLAEHSLPGTPIGESVVATDPDGDTLMYTLEGTDAAVFDIDESTGAAVHHGRGGVRL